MGVLKQPTELFPAANGSLPSRTVGRRHQDPIALALMWTFFMIMGDVLGKRMPQARFPHQDQPRQGFVLDGADPSFGVCVQIRTPRRQRDPCHSRGFNGLLKRGAELAISVVDEVLP
jgi:hypothetical protein